MEKCDPFLLFCSQLHINVNCWLYLMQVYLGEQHVNNPKLSDVTFLVEGGDAAAKLLLLFCCFYAHN